MAFLGTHVLLISHGFPEADDRAFNEWYIREHMPERVIGLPGFNRGRRYRAIDDGPKYMAFYEVTDAGALSSESYLKLVRNFDPHSRQFVPRFERASRTVSIVRASAGQGEGGVLALIGFEAAPQADARLRNGGAQSWAQELVTRYGVTGAHLLEADPDALNHSRQGHLRQGDIVLPWTLLIEAINETALDAVWNETSNAESLAARGVGNVILRGRYRTLFSLTALHSLKPSS